MRLIENRVLFEYILLATCGLTATLGQIPASPCPAVFSYQQDAHGWYGLITARSSSYGDQIKTVVYMYYIGQPKGDDVGNLVRLTSNEELADVLNTGGALRYRVDLNVHPPPRLSKVEFSGRALCDTHYEDGQIGATVVRREHTLVPNANIEVLPARPVANRPETARPVTLHPGYYHPISMGLNMEQFRTTVQQYRPTEDPFRPTTEWARPIPQYRPSALTSSADCGIQRPTTKIWIMQDSKTQPGEWAWLVALFHSSDRGLTFQCGASLLGNRFIVTAAHCLYNTDTKEQVDIENVAIIVGARDVSLKTDNQDFRRLSAIYVHEDYDKVTNINDIALLALEQPVTYSNTVKPCCLWEGEDDQERLVTAGQHGTVVGWGETGKGQSLQEPLRIDVGVVPLSTCQALDSLYHGLTTDNSLCAGNRANEGPCSGFDGSGLYIEQNGRWRLRGVVSTYLRSSVSSISCNPASYIIYTDVAKYKDWIKDARCRWAQL